MIEMSDLLIIQLIRKFQLAILSYRLGYNEERSEGGMDEIFCYVYS